MTTINEHREVTSGYEQINDCLPHECPECGQECTCCTRLCSHPETAECGVAQNFEELPDWR